MYSKSVWARYIYQIKWQLGFFWPTLSSRKSQLPEVVLQKDKFWAVKMKVQQGARLPQSPPGGSKLNDLKSQPIHGHAPLESGIGDTNRAGIESSMGKGERKTSRTPRHRSIHNMTVTKRSVEYSRTRTARGEVVIYDEDGGGSWMEGEERRRGRGGRVLTRCPFGGGCGTARGRGWRATPLRSSACCCPRTPSPRQGGSRGVGHGMPGPGAIRRRNETRGGGRQCGAVRTWWGAATATLLSADCTRPDFRFFYKFVFLCTLHSLQKKIYITPELTYEGWTT
jgi:hypothetical protein